MPNGKFIRGLAALLMILALVLPVSPGFAADEQVDGEVAAANLPAGPGGSINTADATGVTPVPTSFATYDRADCPPTSEQTGVGGPIGVARYVVTIDGVTGTGAQVLLLGTGTGNSGQLVTLTNGNFENQAFDGVPCYFDINCPSDIPAASPLQTAHLTCGIPADLQPTAVDGQSNDWVTPFIKSHNPAVGNPGSNNAADGYTWDLLIVTPGNLPRRYNLSLITDNRGIAANGAVPYAPANPPLAPTAAPLCGIDTFACNIGLGTVSLVALPVVSGFGTVSGVVFGANGLPLGNVTVVLTDALGGIHTTLSQPGSGFWSFPGTLAASAGTAVAPFIPATASTSGDFIPNGPANLVFADNINDYTCAATGAAPFPQNCGHLAAASAVTINGSVAAFINTTLQVKATEPTAPTAGTAGVFGYAVTNKPSTVTTNSTVAQGVGGIRVDAFLGNVTPVTNVTIPVQTVFTDPTTGRWRMNGLTAGTTYTFVASVANTAGNPATNFAVNPAACAVAGSTQSTTTPNNNAIGITIGTCIDVLTTGAAGTWTDPVFVIVTPAAQAVAVPPVGTGFITGLITDANGQAVAGTTVVLYRLTTGQSWGTQTTANGQYFFGALPPSACPLATAPAALGSSLGCTGLPFDTYTVTALDTRFPEQCATGVAVTAVTAVGFCGGLPQSQQVILGPGNPTFGVPATGSNNGVAVVNIAMQAKVAPGGVACIPGATGCVPVGGVSPTSTTLTAGQAGVFGYVVESAAGTRIPGAVIQFIPAGVTVPATLGQVGTVACGSTGLFQVPNSTSLFNACVQANTDASGRYQVILSPGVAYTAQIILPPGFTGSCTVGANALCTLGATFTQFSIPANLQGGFWYDGGSFALGPSSAVSGVPNGQVAESLQLVLLPVFRNPDTTFTGVDIETMQIRIMNNGAIRTGVRIDWWQTSSDEVASLAKTDTFDLNPGAVAIFTRTFVPDGCTRCYAEVYSVDLDLTGLNYGLSDLQGTITNRVVEADNAMAGHNGSTNEDMFQGPLSLPSGVASPGFAVTCIPGTFGCPTGLNTAYYVSTVYKNYGGGVNKWNSVISACLTRGSLTTGLFNNTPFTNPITGLPNGIGTTFPNISGAGQPVVFNFFPISGSTAPNGPFQVTRFAQPGGCAVINLSSPDPDNPDFGGVDILPTGAYAVEITSTGGLLVPTQFQQGGVNRPNGFFSAAVSYTTTGKMAISNNGASALGTEPLSGNTIRQLYGALIFKRYNDWNTGFVVTNSPTVSGGANADVTVTLYGEDGTVMGSFTDSIGGESARVYYMPTFPIQLPDGFRGTAVITWVNVAGTFPTTQSGSNARLAAGATNVNYERNQAISYNFYRQDSLPLSLSGAAGGTGTGEAQFVNPCFLTVGPAQGTVQPIQLPSNAVPAPAGAVPNCLAAPAVERQVASDPTTRAEVPSGPTTGIRLYNPDPSRTGLGAFASVTYLDPSGVIMGNSITTVTIPALGTATVFLGADSRLPDFFTGTAVVLSDQPLIGVGNVVDYGVRTRDGSWAYNLPNQRGFTS
jgi:hypothetical protein